MLKNSLCEKLLEFEEILPELLTEKDAWKSINVNHQAPSVKRIWRNWQGYRINLHKLTKVDGKEEYFHSHPWPIAIRLLTGSYQMCYEFVQDEQVMTGVEIITPETPYCMENPNDKHSIKLLDNTIYSLMINGKAWASNNELAEQEIIAHNLETLSSKDIEEIFSVAKEYCAQRKEQQSSLK